MSKRKTKKFTKKAVQKIDVILKKMMDKKESYGRLFTSTGNNKLLCLECWKPLEENYFEEHFDCILAYNKKPFYYLGREIQYQYMHDKDRHKKCVMCKKSPSDCVGVIYISIPSGTIKQREESMMKLYEELRDNRFRATDQILPYCTPCSHKVNIKEYDNSMGYYLTFLRKTNQKN